MIIIMSTRCNIGFYGDGTDKDLEKPEVLLYRHSDGYPEGVLPDIVPFLKRFNAKRGLNDTEYASAWLMFHLVSLHAGMMRDIKAESKSEYIPEDGYNFIGNGICGDRVSIWISSTYMRSLATDWRSIVSITTKTINQCLRQSKQFHYCRRVYKKPYSLAICQPSGNLKSKLKQGKQSELFNACLYVGGMF